MAGVMARARPLRRVKTDGFAPVRDYGRSLPDVEEGTMYGTPALKVGGKMFACIASHRSAEPDTLVVRIPFAQRDELIEADPSTYYLTDHYVDYASVLVRLSRIRPDALRDLLLTAWRFMRRGRTPRLRSDPAPTPDAALGLDRRGRRARRGRRTR